MSATQYHVTHTCACMLTCLVIEINFSDRTKLNDLGCGHLSVNADHEADEYSYSLAIQVENWCQVKKRFVVYAFHFCSSQIPECDI